MYCHHRGCDFTCITSVQIERGKSLLFTARRFQCALCNSECSMSMLYAVLEERVFGTITGLLKYRSFAELYSSAARKYIAGNFDRPSPRVTWHFLLCRVNPGRPRFALKINGRSSLLLAIALYLCLSNLCSYRWHPGVSVVVQVPARHITEYSTPLVWSAARTAQTLATCPRPPPHVSACVVSAHSCTVHAVHKKFMYYNIIFICRMFQVTSRPFNNSKR